MLSHEPRGYAQIVDMCARFGVELTFTCVEMRDTEHDPSHMCSPEGLLDQVLRTAAARGVKVHGENALSRFDTEAFSHILSAYGRGGDCDEAGGALLSAKSASGSLQSSFSADDTVMLMDAASPQDTSSDSNVSVGAYADVLKSFTYLRADDELFEPANFARFANFVKRMSGLPN
jgi:beta-amylase